MILSWIILITASLICYTGFAFRRRKHLDWLELLTSEEMSSEPDIAEKVGFKMLILGLLVVVVGIWTYYYEASTMTPLLVLILLIVSGYIWIRVTK